MWDIRKDMLRRFGTNTTKSKEKPDKVSPKAVGFTLDTPLWTFYQFVYG